MSKQDQIAKITIELESSSAGRLQKEEDYLQVFRAQTVEALEKALEELALPPAILRLNKLELDLGEIPEGLVGREYKYRLTKAFKEKLEDALAEVAVYPAAENELVEENPLAYRHQVLQFLSTGQLPWSVGHDKKEIATVFLALLSEEKPQHRLPIEEILGRKTYLKRLLDILDEGQEEKLLDAHPILQKKKKLIIPLLDEWKQKYKAGKLGHDFATWKRLHDYILEVIFTFVHHRKALPEDLKRLHVLVLQTAIEEKKLSPQAIQDEEMMEAVLPQLLEELQGVLSPQVSSQLSLIEKQQLVAWGLERQSQDQVAVRFLPVLEKALEKEGVNKLLTTETIKKASLPYVLQLLDVLLPIPQTTWSYVVKEIYQAYQEEVNTSETMLIRSLLEEVVANVDDIKPELTTTKKAYSHIDEIFRKVIIRTENKAEATVKRNQAVSEWVEEDTAEILRKRALEWIKAERFIKPTGQSYTAEEIEELLEIWAEEKGVKSLFSQLLEDRKKTILKWIETSVSSFSDAFQQKWEAFVKQQTTSTGELNAALQFLQKQLDIQNEEELRQWLKGFIEGYPTIYKAPTQQELLAIYSKDNWHIPSLLMKAKGKQLLTLWKKYPQWVEMVLTEILQEEIKRSNNPEYWLKAQKLWSKPIAQLLKDEEALPWQSIVERWLQEQERALKAEQVPEGFKEEEPIYVDNAGLVILNPYVGRLFKMLGYVDGNAFVNEEKQQRAACLLQYLATSQKHFAEFDLTINKLFCGMQVTDYVDPEIVLTDKELETCDSMLKAVISHWKAIGNSSIDNLRASFLMRPGVLKKEIQGWKLTVEKKAFDILLERLPWGIGMVKFAWMEEVIVVEWMN